MITVDDLKSELKDYSWDMLTEGDATVGDKALDTARIWIRARLYSVGIEYDPALEDTDEVVRQIVLYYALYRLYAYAEQESMASDKKAGAVELMSAYLSASAARDPVAVSGSPIAAISKPVRRRKR